jgi:hypothetical protein
MPSLRPDRVTFLLVIGLCLLATVTTLLAGEGYLGPGLVYKGF